MRLYREVTAWVNYFAAQLAFSQIDEKYAEEKLNKVFSICTIQHKSEKNVSMAKALAYEDERYLEAKDELQKTYAYRKLVEALYNNADRDSFFISRELSRRLGRNDRENRNSKWNT